MIFDLFLVFLGIGLLFWGGEMLVTSSSRIGRLVGMSPLIVGLVVVAFATSCPELATSLVAAMNGSTDMALGNVVGSNIANLGLILGATVCVVALRLDDRAIFIKVVFMIAISVLTMLLQIDGVIGRIDGVVLLLALVGFLAYLLKKKAKIVEVGEQEEEISEHYPLEQERMVSDEDETIDALTIDQSPVTVSLVKSIFGVVVGTLILVAGAKSLVEGGSDLARLAGISERVIGLTLLALGTSLPELAASLVAARQRQGGMILGNVVGSNIFNLLGVLGLTALAYPVPMPSADVWVDLSVMLVVSVMVLPMLTLGSHVTRLEGALLLMVYAGYVAWLFIT